METTKLGYANTSAQKGSSFWPVYLCFMVFGLLIPFSKPELKVTTILFSVLLSLTIGLLAVNLLITILNSGNPTLRMDTEGLFARQAVGNGMLFMIPFTVLSVLAQLVLGWDAVMPFASAAITTSAATTGTEALRKGAQGTKNVMLPSALAFLLSAGWMLLVGLLP